MDLKEIREKMAKGLGWEIAFILFFIPSILSAEAINITAVGG